MWKPSDTEETNLLLAQTVLECALPFSLVEHPAFVTLIKKLNPQYELPCAKTLSTTQLDDIFTKTQILVNHQLKNSSVVLSVDQSQDGAGDPIAHVVAIPPSGVPFLLEEVPHYTEQHTAENLMETITECAVKLEEINTRISGLINDNENKSMLLRQKFNDKYKNVVVHTPGDPPHAAQKVVQDIIESNTFKPTNTKATFLADKFKNTRLKQFLKQELDIEDGRVSTNMPVITRWGSHLKMYQTLMKHTWQRASLGREKLAKMIYIYVNRAALRRVMSLK